jgi:hypothetical protein
MNAAIILVVVVVCLVALGVGAYFLLKPKTDEAQDTDMESLPAVLEAPAAIPIPLEPQISVQGWPVVSPSEPIAPVSPEPMAATTSADDLTTMPAEIPVEASTAELDLARADPTAGLFPSTADLSAQEPGASQVAPLAAPAPVLAPVLAPAPAQAKTKAKVCGGTRIWDGKVCRERSVKPAAAAKLGMPPVTIPPAKSKGCGPGKKCRPPKGPAPVGDGKAARKVERDAKRRDRSESSNKKKCKLGNTAKYDYTTKIESSPNQYDWHCPSGYKSTGCTWSDLPDGTEARHCRKRKTSGSGSSSSSEIYDRAIETQRRLKAARDEDRECPPGRYRDAKTKDCRPNRGGLSDQRMTERSAQLAASNAASPPTTPNAPHGQPVTEGSRAWNDTLAYRAARQNEQRAKVEGPASDQPNADGCPPGRSRDPKTKNCRPTAALIARQKKVADAATARAVQRKGRYISNSGKGRSAAEVAAEVARRGGDWND